MIGGLHLWTPKDPDERPRPVQLLRLAYVDGVLCGAWVIECDRVFPWVAFAHLLELRKTIRHD